MKMIVAGGRDFRLLQKHERWLDKLVEKHGVTEIVSGGAYRYLKYQGRKIKVGADYGGEVWAAHRGIKLTRFLPMWREFNRAAGPIRNEQMAVYADVLAAFPGGRGTASMTRLAKENGLIIEKWTYG